MEEYVSHVSEVAVSAFAVRREGKGGLQYFFGDELNTCDNRGHSSELGTVTHVCFRRANQTKFADVSIPYKEWISLGRPNTLTKREIVSYSPKQSSP